MSINTRVRFLEPIDPREVFNFTATLVNTPPGGYKHAPAGSEPMHDGDWWPLNPRIRTTGGSDASVKVEYGYEGSALVEEWDAYPQYADDYPPAQRAPRAYVELDIESSGGYLYEKHPEWLGAISVRWAVAMVVQEIGGEWRPL